MKKKILQISKKEVEALIKKSFGIDYCAEDRAYDVPTIDAFDETRLQKILGMQEWFYITDGFDCDDFAMLLRTNLKRRYWKKHIRQYGSRNGVPYKAGIFVQEIKVQYPEDKLPHWFVVGIANVNGTATLIYRERTATHIIKPVDGWHLIKLS